MQGHRDRVALGGLVVALTAAGAEERVEVDRGAHADLAVRDAGQREVEQDQAAALAGHLAQREVVRLDVAVPDLLLLQVEHRVQQVLAQLLQLADAQRALLADLVGERALARAVQDDHRPPGHLERPVDQPDYPGVGQLPEGGRLPAEPLRGGGAEGHLEDLALTSLVGQQCPGSGALAEHPLHDPASDDRALARRQRIRLLGWLRSGQLVLDVVEVPEEIPHRLGAVGGLDRGGAADQPVHRRR